MGTSGSIEASQGRTAARDALTCLVKEHVGEGRPLTLRAFAERAIDPKTGTTISKSTVGNLVTGSRIKITPEVLGAIAAGLDVPLRLVQAAAAEQYVGLVLDHESKPPQGEATMGISELAELIAEQSRSINELESKVAELAADHPDEK